MNVNSYLKFFDINGGSGRTRTYDVYHVGDGFTVRWFRRLPHWPIIKSSIRESNSHHLGGNQIF